MSPGFFLVLTLLIKGEEGLDVSQTTGDPWIQILWRQN